MLRPALYSSFAILVLAFGLWASGLGNMLAVAIYNPESHFAWAMREWSNILPLALTFAGLFFLMWPKWGEKYPLLRRTAAVWALVSLLAVGLLNQVLIKQMVQRPRPRESVLVHAELDVRHSSYVTTLPTVALKGNSMPSGHGGVGFLMLVPFFTLWPVRKRVALGFLAGGLAYGGVVSWARMTLGAHYASDLLVALAINVAAAGIFAHYITARTRISPLWPIGVLVLAGGILVATKRFTINTHWQGHVAEPVFNLPCPVALKTDTAAAQDTLDVTIYGKGVPETFVYVVEKAGVFSIRHVGLQYGLTCDAVWTSGSAAQKH